MKSYSNPEDCPAHLTAIARLRGVDTELQEDAKGTDGNDKDMQSPSSAGEAVLTAPEETPSLPRSGTLGLCDSDTLMCSRYVNLIGIVGLPNAGKTACIASLYLLLAHGMLDGFSYANSQTLMALDEIARGTRRWNDGNPPDQMTAHTELADDRQAGFLHLRLRRNTDGRKFDLLMPDLPGEWSRTLIANGDADKFGFLKAAEVVWLMVDGREFVEEKTRQFATYQLSNLIERLAFVLPTPRPRVILVASWHDKGDFPKATLERVQDYGESLGFAIEFAPIASFSDNDSVEPGIGLAELISKTVAGPPVRPDPWPAGVTSPPTRAFLSFGNPQ